MMHYSAKQKIYEINGTKLGGDPGLRPTVLVGSIFYRHHRIMIDEGKGTFDREAAENVIKTQEEFSDKTGNPCMLDVIGASSEAMIKALDFTAEASSCPLFMDGLSAEIRVDGLRYVNEVGLQNRVIYNSINPECHQDELEALSTYKAKSVVALAYYVKDFTARGRLRCLMDIIPRLEEKGVENVIVDTCVLDIPSLGSACQAIQDVKDRLGYPAGCGAHNAIGTWRGLKKKMGMQAKAPSSAVASALSVASGADFVLYGPVETAEYIFPAIALANTVYAQISTENGLRPDRSHPKFRIA